MLDNNRKPRSVMAVGTGLYSHSVDTDLSKVHSFDKRQELYNVLHSEDPCHNERLWFTGFLKYAGYSLEEICAIIDQEASWCDYDANMTYCQVSSVFRGSGSSNDNTKGISSQRGTCANGGKWLSKEEWNKRYGKRPMCALHYVSCSECPDVVDGHCGKVTK